MHYAGFLIRRERLKKDWSQEGLCMGICTVSYLSKIEQGKADPSPEITRLILERMGLDWDDGEDLRDIMESAYDALMAGDFAAFHKIASGEKWKRLETSPFAPDKILMDCIVYEKTPDIEEELEVCLTKRQLALLRILQGHEDEALTLFPCAMTYYHAGINKYSRGHTAQALELFQNAYDMAAQDGYVHVMMNARVYMGNCYSDKHDIPAMEAHYKVALRLAKAVGDENITRTIPYNIAATKIETGEYAEALEYLENCNAHTAMSLHKLAICYEKTCRPDKAMDAIVRAEKLNADEGDNPFLGKIIALVKMRLENPGHLKDDAYGEALMDVFRMCRDNLAMGYAIFHLPWVLEWYESHRLYKQAYALLLDFPEMHMKTDA